MLKKALKVLPLLLLVLGILLFIRFLNDVGFDNVLRLVSGVSLASVVLFILNMAMINVFPAIAWCIHQSKEDDPISFWDALKANIMGFPLNYITPSMYLGSEPLKVYLITKKYGYSTSKVIGTVIVTKFQEFIALFVATLLCLVYVIIGGGVLSFWQATILVSIAMILLFLVTVIMYLYTKGMKPLTKMMLALRFMKRRKVVNIAKKLRHIEVIINNCMRVRWKTFILTQFIVAFSTVSVVIRPIFIPLTIGGNSDLLNLSHVSLIFVFTNLIATFQIVPGSLGVYEYGLYGYASLSGLSEQSVAIFSLFTRVSELFLFGVGMIMLVHFGLLVFLSSTKNVEPD